MHKIEFKIPNPQDVMSPEKLTGRGSLVDQVYKLLRKNIINLNLPPEMPLVEKEIASILKISKTPVREALIRLTYDQLVTIIPKSGSYVTAISLDRYLEACFIRQTLESGCVRRLAKNGISLTEQVKLKSIIAKQRQIIEKLSTQNDTDQDIDYSELFSADELFHQTLFECAGISGAWKLMHSAKSELDRVRHLLKIMGGHRHSEIIEEHTNILQSILDKDPEAAEDLIAYHIGGIDETIKNISENIHFLNSIEEFNLLIDAQRKGRNKRKWHQKKAS